MTAIEVKKEMVHLSDEEVLLMGDYELDKLKYLNMFKAHQDDEQENQTSNAMWEFLNAYEQYVFHFANQLGGEQYRNGYWKMDNGFFILQGNDETKFNVSNNFGFETKLNLLEFSITVNLFALSHLCFWAHDRNKTLINNLAVFFSDYTKDFLKKNSEILSEDIYIIID